MEVNFDSLNMKFSDLIKTYSPELQREIFEYINGLDDRNKQAYNIAYEHLGTSFNIARSNGFKLWREVYKYLNSLNEEKKSELHYDGGYLFDREEISESKDFKDWKKKSK